MYEFLMAHSEGIAGMLIAGIISLIARANEKRNLRAKNELTDKIYYKMNPHKKNIYKWKDK